MKHIRKHRWIRCTVYIFGTSFSGMLNLRGMGLAINMSHARLFENHWIKVSGYSGSHNLAVQIPRPSWQWITQHFLQEPLGLCMLLPQLATWCQMAAANLGMLGSQQSLPGPSTPGNRSTKTTSARLLLCRAWSSSDSSPQGKEKVRAQSMKSERNWVVLLQTSIEI